MRWMTVPSRRPAEARRAQPGEAVAAEDEERREA